jgi:hypothetical protein
MLFVRVTRALFRLIAVPSLVTSLVFAIMLLISGSLSFFPMVFWGKVGCTGMLLVYVFYYQQRGFYFFHNLGYSRRHVLMMLALADGIIAMGLFTISLVLL